ncbi:MAG: roadblock/LC7 domain-containing protein [Thermoplasmata archaeon]|nr:roadblock/LC7 domain-containing protein [Thermoplasmata archaeon]
MEGIDTELKPALRALRDEFGAFASAIVSRDGLIMAGDIPDDISGETFGIMCATLLGAASTAHSELKISTPLGVVVESEDALLILVGAGRKALIVAAMPSAADCDAARKRLEELAETIKLI